MVFMQANSSTRALGVGHAVVQLGSELIDLDPVTLKHHQQMVHHIRSLVAQVIACGILLFDERLHHARMGALMPGQTGEHRASGFDILARKTDLVSLFAYFFQGVVGLAG